MTNNDSHQRTGAVMLLLLAAIALITFITAVLTPPFSGPWCKADCFEYPFTDIAGRFPRDYYWMYMAIILYVVYIPAIVIMHYQSPVDKRAMSATGVIFATAGAFVLIADYFLQLSVIQVSLLNNETDGISLLTQYNPHGIFIVLEELGYLLITIAFLFQSMMHTGKGLSKTIRIVFLSGFIISILSLIIITTVMGIHREYAYEIVLISIVWLVFIINGVLIGRQMLRKSVKSV